jgi:Glycosyl transferase family 2
MKVCLSMIVKNEAPVIERCLRSVKPYIHAWAISDTGSSDGTQDIVRRFMADLPGELIERPWVDFSTNRNHALELAKKHGDYALVIDADEVLEGDAGFAWGALGAPGYMLEIVFNELLYRRVAMPRLDADWRWEGVLHEALVSPNLTGAEVLKGLRIRVFTDGARSRQPQAQKFQHDADVLRKALEKEPGNARYAFYYAQSLRDAGDLAGAAAAYEKRAAMGGWAEEIYFSLFQAALLRERSGTPYPNVVAAYLDACNSRTSRAEAPCELARYFRLNQRYALGRHFAQIAAQLPVSNDLLFIDRAVHEWRAHDEWSVSAYWCGEYAESARLCRELLADARLPERERERVQKNLEFAQAKL